MTIHVYAGPTIPASRLRRILPAAELHPPVRHGDVLRHARTGDTVLIIDGLWHQVAPVRHKELLHLLDEGVTVVGAASMGALRAAELHPYGMIGVGWVYQAYRDGVIDADDEVAVIQTPEGRPLSDALVNIRYTLAAARERGAITTDEATDLLDLARALPYQRRTWQALRRLASATCVYRCVTRMSEWPRRKHSGSPRPSIRSGSGRCRRTRPSPSTGWTTSPSRTSPRSLDRLCRPPPRRGACGTAPKSYLSHWTAYGTGRRWRRSLMTL
jgi:hypothetical protein